MGRREGSRSTRGKEQVHQYSSDPADHGLKTLEHELATQGLYIKDITGDGNCLFRSLADQIGEPNTHGQIRHDVVKWLRDRNDEFAVFVEEEYSSYLDRMAQDGCYGDNLEIVAYSRLTGKAIKIYQPGVSYIVQVGSSTGSSPRSPEMLHIVYHSYEHYSSVRNQDGPHEGPSSVLPKETIVQQQVERPKNAPASDLEKICLASVPGIDLEQVRQVMKQSKGNVNQAVELLLEEQCQRDVESALAVVAGDDRSQLGPDILEAEAELERVDRLQMTSLSKADGVDRASDKSSVRIAPEGKRPSARAKKEEAKKVQKQNARERKRKDKTRAAEVDDTIPKDMTKTINI